MYFKMPTYNLNNKWQLLESYHTSDKKKLTIEMSMDLWHYFTLLQEFSKLYKYISSLKIAKCLAIGFISCYIRTIRNAYFCL